MTLNYPLQINMEWLIETDKRNWVESRKDDADNLEVFVDGRFINFDVA